MIYRFSINEDTGIIDVQSCYPAVESIDNLSTDSKNLSTERRRISRNNQTLFRFRARIPRSKFCRVCQNRPIIDRRDGIIDRPITPSRLLAAITAQVTAQVEGIDNLLMQKYLRELAAALGITTAQVASEVTGEVAGEVTAPVTASVRRILELLSVRGELGNVAILSAFELKSRRRMRETYLEPALRESLIEYTIPVKPTSSLQKYRLTDKGRSWLVGRKP